MHAVQDDGVQFAASNSAPLALDTFGSEIAKTTITVTIASNRRALHAAWRSALARGIDIEIKGEPVLDSTTLAACVEHHLPNVVLLDKALLDKLDPRSLQRAREQHRNMRILLLWDEICPSLVADVLRHRFQGLLLTTCTPEIGLKAIRAVCRGELWLSRASLAMVVADLLSEPGDEAVVGVLGSDSAEALTPRELQVVELLRRGCINKEIARALGIMEDTVKKHLHSVYAKLGVHRRAHVALRRLPGCSAPHAITHAHRLQIRGATETGN
ncbi:response regulator transcription factor [Lysobacter tyrosinilyticus]